MVRRGAREGLLYSHSPKGPYLPYSHKQVELFPPQTLHESQVRVWLVEGEDGDWHSSRQLLSSDVQGSITQDPSAVST